jgi:hypothetical protein
MNWRFSLIIPILPAAILAFVPVSAQVSTSSVSIILPPRLLSNASATLAILGSDGHLAPGVTVDIGNGQRVTTDATGRASFTAPPDGAFIATASGVSAASLVDAAPPAASQGSAPAVVVAPDVSQHDRFAICGGSGFRGDVAADSVTINGDPAFVLAASPLCVVVLPQARTLAGRARIEIDAAGARSSGVTTLVALDFVPPKPPLLPGRKGKLYVRAEGTTDPLRIVTENHSPDVIEFTRGETQELRTSGGAQNQAPIQVQAIRSGDFSFHARILAPPDPASAARYLEIAEGIAPKSAQKPLREIVEELTRHPRDSAKAAAALGHIASSSQPGALRALLDAARSAL